MPFNQIDGFPRLELRLQHNSSAMSQCCRQSVGSTVGPEQRRGQQDAVFWSQSLPLADIEAILDRTVMAEAYGLRRAA